jgi:F-type H+-transporting ATPase subunit epsilon
VHVSEEVASLSTVLVEVVTPERIVLSTQVNQVNIRTGGGELGILPRHAPLAATVKPGVVKVKLPEGDDYIHVTGGFLEILPDRITILADVAEVASQIDADRATQAKERAEKRLSGRPEELDTSRAEAALIRAVTRLEVVELSNRAGHVLGKKVTQ